jgi:hypothetical protein
MTAFQKIKTAFNSFIESICTALIIFFFGTSFLAAFTVVVPAISFICGTLLSVVFLGNRLYGIIATQLRIAFCNARPLFKKLVLETITLKGLTERRKAIVN